MAETVPVTSGAAAGEAAAVCVFLHGRLQTPDEMLDQVIRPVGTEAVRFVLPKSPREAWYDARAVDPLTAETEVQLAEALSLLDDTVRAARAASPGVPLVLAGFSQGACVVLEYLMRRGEADAAAILTGCRVGAVGDDLPRRPLGGMPVYVTDSEADPWIPLWAYAKALAELAQMGARLRADIVPGRAHGVAPTEIAAFADLLEAAADRRSPWGTTS